MSAISGKCDVFDIYSDSTDEYLARSRFYILTPDGREHRIHVHTWKDLALYSPYLVVTSVSDKDSAVVHLSRTSYIDAEEAEHLSYALDDAKRYFRRRRRKKCPADLKEVYHEIHYFGNFEEAPDTDPYKAIVLRVERDGDKATIDGLHDSLHEMYRKNFLEYLVSLGYERDFALRHVYGWKRARAMMDDCI